MKYNQKLISAAILVSSLMISGSIVASAQTTSTAPAPAPTSTQTSVNPFSKLTFPVAELGNCSSVSDCKTYCDVQANQSACLNFAQTHGLMTANQVSRAKEVLSAVKNGAGPGGCTTKDSCETYCSDRTHAAECVAFAEKNGILKGKDLEEAQKVLPFIESGQTPGGCTTKDACEAYCSNSSHVTECATFAQKAGLISQTQANAIIQTGGKGPGGCNSQESCANFCNQKENQQACFDFAKQHNLIPAAQLKQIQQGAAQLRAGLSQMPQQVLQCLTGKVGSSTVDQIESGQLMPNQDIGDAVSGCFKQFQPQMAAQMQQNLKNAPSQVLSCLQSSLTSDEYQKLQQGEIDNQDVGDKVKNCFEQMRENASGTEMQNGTQFNNMPPQAQDCIRQKLGVGQGTSTTPPTQEQVQAAVEQCNQQLRNGAASGTMPGIPNQEQNREQMMQRVIPGNASGTSPSREGEQPPIGAPGNFPTGQIQNMIQGKVMPPQETPRPESQRPEGAPQQPGISPSGIPLQGTPPQGTTQPAPVQPQQDN